MQLSRTYKWCDVVANGVMYEQLVDGECYNLTCFHHQVIVQAGP